MTRPSEIARFVLGSLFGTVTAGVGLVSNSFWAVFAGSLIGASSVAWTFGIWLRDRTFQFQKMQVDEAAKERDKLWDELVKLRAEIAVERGRGTKE